MLAFGAVYPWAWAPLVAAAVVVGAASIWRGIRAQTLPVSLSAALACVLVSILAQLLPLPAPVLDTISPAAGRFLTELDLGYTLAAAVARPPPAHALSIDPAATSRGLLFFSSFTLLFIGLSAVLTPRDARRLADAVFVLSVGIALIGIAQERGSDGRIYGFWQPQGVSEPFGPFVNRNHFGGWMLMAIPLGLGRLCERLAATRLVALRGWRRRLLWCASPPAARIVLCAFGLAVMALALVMTMSRSAMASLAAALALIAICFVAGERGWRRAVIVAFLLALPAGAVGWVGLDAINGRFTSTARVDLRERATAWRDAIGIIRDFAATGTGVNSYGTATILYANPSLTHHYSAAHSDYLQLAAEGGLLVGIPVLIVFTLFVRAVRARLRQDAELPWLRIGAIAALAAIGLQELVDFSLQIPANAALFAVAAAIAVHRSTAPTRAVTHR